MAPIETIHLFPALDQKLVSLLQSLTPSEWNQPTIAKLWTVKDIAAHLLDGNLRSLSIARDGYFGDPPGTINVYEDLVHYLNRLNADWVTAMKRISPAVLIEWLSHSNQQYYEYLLTLDPTAPAIFPVSWSGDEISPNWFHIAREYTEQWHHQQQIRDAVNKPGILTQELYHPFLETFMMALPHTYRHTIAPEGTTLQFTITGEGGGNWYLTKHEKWTLSKTPAHSIVAHTTIDGAIAWKLFSKSLRRNDVLAFVAIEGDTVLGDTILDMVSVMA